MTDQQLIEGCRIAVQYDAASVCIKPYAVNLAKEQLRGSDVLVGTVIGFPHGNSPIGIKLGEADYTIQNGAVEIDMVVNIGKVLSQDWNYISEEISQINNLVVSQNAILKVIFENDYLSDDDKKIMLCKICNEHNVAFVKTSTGYGFTRNDSGMYSYSGATDHDLIFMRRYCLPSIQVKAAGGVRSLDDLLRVRSLGVTRVGAKEIILFAARRFRVGEELEERLHQMGSQPPQQEQDPNAAADAMKMQIEQQKLELERMKIEGEQALEAQKLMLEQAKLMQTGQIESKKIEQKHIEALINRDTARINASGGNERTN